MQNQYMVNCMEIGGIITSC